MTEAARDDIKKVAREYAEGRQCGGPITLSPPAGGQVYIDTMTLLRDERRAIARTLLRRADSSTVKAVAEALRIVAHDICERSPGDSIKAMEAEA